MSRGDSREARLSRSMRSRALQRRPAPRSLGAQGVMTVALSETRSSLQRLPLFPLAFQDHASTIDPQERGHQSTHSLYQNVSVRRDFDSSPWGEVWGTRRGPHVCPPGTRNASATPARGSETCHGAVQLRQLHRLGQLCLVQEKVQAPRTQVGELDTGGDKGRGGRCCSPGVERREAFVGARLPRSENVKARLHTTPREGQP